MRDNGKHGCTSHGIRAADVRLSKGQPFDGFMRDLYLDALGRRGLDEPALDGLGARGDVIKHTARLGVVAELVWSGMLMAATAGDVHAFFGLLEKHGGRLNQAIAALHRELELEAQDGGVIDYEEMIARENATD